MKTEISNGVNNVLDRFEWGSKILLILFAAMLPLWFVPVPIGLELGREISFVVVAAAAFILWLLSILTRGEIRFSSSLSLFAGGFLLLVFAASTFLSGIPLISFIFGEPIAEKLSTLILGLIVMVLFGSVHSSPHEAKRPLAAFVLASAAASFFSFLQLAFGVNIWRHFSSVADSLQFNVVGTLNGLALFYTTVLVMVLGLLFSPSSSKQKPWLRFIFFISAVLFLLNLSIIHFQTAWIVLLGSLIFFFGLLFMHMRTTGRQNQNTSDWAETKNQRRNGFDWRHSITVFLIALAVVMLVIQTPLLGPTSAPAEVSPTFGSTFNVAKQVYQEGNKSLFLGSGPATFNVDWARYKDPAINQTLFWGFIFTQGSSWFSTLLPTVGLLGVLAFILFIGVSFFLFLRHLLRHPREEKAFIEISLFVGFVSLVLSALLYPSTSTLVLALFFLIGLLHAFLARPLPETGPMTRRIPIQVPIEDPYGMAAMEQTIPLPPGEETSDGGWWSISKRIVRFDSSWLVFLSSLFAIFFLALSTASAYFEIGRLRTTLISQHGVDLFNQGHIDEAIGQFDQAARLEDKNYLPYYLLLQARMEKIRNLIQRAAGGQNVQQDFQTTVSLAIQNAQRTVALNPLNPLVWRTQGALYEMLIPFIPGSEKFSFDSYRRASDLEPLNPATRVDLGRAGLVAADRLALAINQAKGTERDQLVQVRTKALEDIMTVLQKAIDLKGDFAAAHFLSMQTALRLGNLPVAIQSAEKTKVAAPFDIGVAFQLGLLYYQNGNFDGAQQEFERAVSLNTDYSNARYFLGLLYDRKGDKARAIDQFERIQKLNPDNQEVKIILTNLRAGRSALETISPPNPPPEKRRELPIKEERKKPVPAAQ